MWSTRFTWIFAALFLLCGLPLLIVDDAGARNLWGGLSAAGLGGFALAMAYNATATGTIRLQFSTIVRAASPYKFWAAVGLVGLAGLGVIAAGGWLLVFKV